jgi:hypothetical protein
MSTLNLIDQLEQTVADQALEIAALKAQQCVGNERGHDTKGSRKALGAINAKLRAKVGMLEREVTRLNASRVPEGCAIVARDWLKHIYRDLDSCQKVIWANMPGCDPSYYEDAQARLAEIDALLSGGEV